MTETDVKEKLLSGLQSPSSTPALRNENLFDPSVDLGQVGRNILQFEREQSLCLIDQVFCFLCGRNGCGTAPAPTRNNKLCSRCQRASEVRCVHGETKVAEAKRLYELCEKFPKLRRVRTGFSPFFSQTRLHLKKVFRCFNFPCSWIDKVAHFNIIGQACQTRKVDSLFELFSFKTTKFVLIIEQMYFIKPLSRFFSRRFPTSPMDFHSQKSIDGLQGVFAGVSVRK